MHSGTVSSPLRICHGAGGRSLAAVLPAPHGRPTNRDEYTSEDESSLGYLGYAEVPASASTVVTKRMPLFAATWLSRM